MLYLRNNKIPVTRRWFDEKLYGKTSVLKVSKVNHGQFPQCSTCRNLITQ